ncbi:hypothetical protein [Sphingosinicella xenopeptidilytica]|uniref:Uncharacterized protein n=1 Tax=Sphingosinicella xenopeptidilytica TaxID=364098 RepID=A0ABW3C8G8_SPHXN
MAGHDDISVNGEMCSTVGMRRPVNRTLILAFLAALPILSGCDRPVSDPAILAGIRAEALSLTVAENRAEQSISAQKYPATIASLHPQLVTVHTWGVDITTRTGFDGGWGYHIPREKRDLPFPAKCYVEAGQNVFWHGPC